MSRNCNNKQSVSFSIQRCAHDDAIGTSSSHLIASLIVCKMGNEQSSIHEPKLHEQPARPALIRSRSIRADANNLTKPAANPYRPKPILKHHSMPYPQTVEPFSSGTNGYESPQWGWYINTTPPSPEMFYSSRNNKIRKGTGSTSDTSEMSRDSVLSNASGNNAYPNPVFQCLQDKHKARPAGWPSVPL